MEVIIILFCLRPHLIFYPGRPPSSHVAEDHLELLLDPPASAPSRAEITGSQHHACLYIFFKKLICIYGGERTVLTFLHLGAGI